MNSGFIHILCALCMLFPGMADGQTAMENYQLVPAEGERPGYFEHTPDAYGNNTDKTYPLLLFLHGMGERGNGNPEDLQRILKWGPPRIVAQNGSSYKAIHPFRFIILAPQLAAPASTWPDQTIHDFLNFALQNYRIDTSRIYLTGVSMGGNGVWKYAYSPLNTPNRLAAIAPVSAWGEPAKGCPVVERNIPVWAFHGMNDQVIRMDRGQAMFAALQNCGRMLPSAKYRFSPLNAAHTAWPPVYASVSDSLSVYDWFMQFTLAPSDTSGSPGAEAEKKIATPVTKAVPWTPPAFENVSLANYGQLPEALNESSGIMIDGNGRLWTHNDSGDKSVLYQIDTTLSLLRSVRIDYARNTDWEDLARDKAGNIYVADIGNNFNVRKKLFIYKLKEGDLDSESATAETISYVYEDQRDFPPGADQMHYDAESLIHYNDNLYIFSKNRTDPFTGYTHIYQLPDEPGDYTARLVDSLKLGEGIMTNFWLTAADISPSGDHIALLSHDKLWILSCFQGKKFSEGKLTELRLNSFTQKEAVTFLDENTLLITDERIRNILGGNLYRLEIPSDVINSCE